MVDVNISKFLGIIQYNDLSKIYGNSRLTILILTIVEQVVNEQ